jgi:copper(I)-binding protein
MLHIDPNLRDAAAVMSVQSSMEIPARRALAWGWRGAGAMLMDLSRPLRIGERIRLRLSWLDATGHRENLSVSAVVTASPSNLQYVAPMAM